MSTAERAFDAAIWTDIEADWPSSTFRGQMSPDGLGPGTGRWRLYHNCPEPRLSFTESDNRSVGIYGGTHRCNGCGQLFTYTAASGK